MRLIAFALLAAFLHTVSEAAEPLTMGFHVYTYHSPEEFECEACGVSNNTPGVYVIHDGWTGGAVRNSYQRWSFYVGKVWSLEGFDFTLGAISGYKNRTVRGPSACPNAFSEELRKHATCSTDRGATNAVLRPLVAASYVFPMEHFIGVSPRFTILGKGLHLSIENTF